MAFNKAAWRRKHYLAHPEKYRAYTAAAKERRKTRGTVRIGRPPSDVSKTDRKREARKKQEARRRLLAQSIGPTYMGKPCKHGHGGNRYTLSAQCVECKAEKQRGRKDRSSQKKWALANKEKVQEIAKAAYWRNPQRYREKSVRNIQKNPAAHNAAVAKRAAAKDQRTPKWANLKKIKDVYKQCAQMRKDTGVMYVVDHIIPLRGEIVSGLHVAENLQILENSVNIRKKNHYAVD